VERQGGFSEEAIMLCSKISEAAANNAAYALDPNLFYKNLLNECAVAIARGNALMQLTGVRDGHHHSAALDASSEAIISGSVLSTTSRWHRRSVFNRSRLAWDRV
jgi:hypothetical protein